ncbi:uncharacterized protein CDV56_103477 [Aspergillus thermomutatus]|uniref:Nucleoside phosphorylase domain-containing protein n=1 Tax=Aspergillus thermomutatus TaxID=41047 RepID=A0A397G4U1_ASPTH|nr:uncharacterized protein CDV56_103477 [Aspergillus thermomutatus]RHZ45995.1 hypothetical protein CDV56_103477 [Aspergillus thermomutatus]
MALGSQLDDCTIVWLCPLEVELRAAIAMLDKVYEEIPPRAWGQNVVYTVGEIGPHKVAVVGYYQEQGLAVSGSMAAEVVRDLPNLQVGLLVGIAGGIPSSTMDMQLGDVLIATPEGDRPGVVGYDLGKAGEDDAFELKHWQNSTNPLLRSVINVVRARDEHEFRRHLRILERRPEFRRPDHPALPKSSGDTWDPQHGVAHPKAHYGTILSGNSVIKSKAKRDHLRDRYGGIAVEMEAAGMMTRLPVAVIRGISDFADSSKNNAWQPYAAITAAAYAKEVLLRLPCVHRADCERPSGHDLRNAGSTPFANRDLRLAQALPEKWAFIGRKEELAFLEDHLGYRAQPPLQRCVVSLWGLTGVGKSQLAAKFVNQQRSNHPEREIFWVSGESRDSFEQSVINMLKAGSHVASSKDASAAKPSQEDRTGLVNSFFAELNRVEDARWLLVVDGINGELRQTPNDSSFLDIPSLVGGLKRGYVLLTSRRRDIVTKYHPIREVKGLKDDDAISLLRLQVDRQLMEEGGVEDLARFLKGSPLALRLAASVISRYRYTVKDYLENWRSRGSDGEFFGGADETLSRSIGFLYHQDLWYDLCFSAVDDTYPTWLQDLARGRKSFRDYYPLLADLSFIELTISTKGHRIWETHPAIQVAARQRATADEQEYIRCAISLVASRVPRSYEESSWETMRRLEPHVELCWSYIKQGRWGPNTNLTELESLGRVFRHVGRYREASLIYRMIESGLSSQTLTHDNAEFLANVLTNLGLVYTRQREFGPALRAFRRSSDLMSALGMLTPDASMSITYNKAVVFMMTERLDEAEALLRQAAAHFSRHPTDQHMPMSDDWKRLYIRILNDFGEVSLQKGSVAAAVDLFHHVYDSQKDWLGDFHPTILSVKLNLGRALTKLHRCTEAQALLTEVIAVYTEWWGRRHPETMRAIDELALAFMEDVQGKQAANKLASSEMQRAEELWKEVLTFYRSIYGDSSDATGRIKSNLQYLCSLRDRFRAVKLSCFHPSSRLYLRENLRYFSTARFAQSTFLNQSFQVPVGNNGHVFLNVTYPSIAPTHGRPSVIIRLPSGPLFQREAEHDMNLPTTHQTPRTSLNSGNQDGPRSEALASITSSTVVTINYRLGAPSTDLASELALSEDEEERRLSAVKKQNASPSQVFYRYPTPVHDTLAGFDWVQQTLRPARLGVIGTHVGGSLALMLALTEAQSVQAVAALEPICDWAGLDEHCLMDEQQAHEENTASKRTRGAGSRIPAAQDLVPLLEAREKFFTTAERYFDAFASPVLFLRSAGKDVPRTFPKYRTGPDYPVPVLVSNKPDRQPIDVWDLDTQDQAIHPQNDIYDSSETDLPRVPESKSTVDPVDATIQGRTIRRRKALSRWPPYGLDYGSSASPHYHMHNYGIKRLEMALPKTRLFVRAREDEHADPAPAPAPDGKRQHPRNPRKTPRRSVLAQQAEEMVDLMRRACFWGREKGYGESRVTLSQVASASAKWPVSGEEDAGRWLGETLFSGDSDAG